MGGPLNTVTRISLSLGPGYKPGVSVSTRKRLLHAFPLWMMLGLGGWGRTGETRYPISIWEMTISILSSPISLAHIPHRYPG